jgi:hypothetical protein
VVTNDCAQGQVVEDTNNYAGGCCQPTDLEGSLLPVGKAFAEELLDRDQYLHLMDKAQKRHSGVWFTNHEHRCDVSAGGFAACRHDHWFTVQTDRGSVMLNGERMGAHSYGGVRVS